MATQKLQIPLSPCLQLKAIFINVWVFTFLNVKFNNCFLHRYGYRGTDSRRNLWVLPTGELLYYVAAVAVMYDRDEESQRHYTGHTEDIQW